MVARVQFFEPRAGHPIGSPDVEPWSGESVASCFLGPWIILFCWPFGGVGFYWGALQESQVKHIPAVRMRRVQWAGWWLAPHSGNCVWEDHSSNTEKILQGEFLNPTTGYTRNSWAWRLLCIEHWWSNWQCYCCCGVQAQCRGEKVLKSIKHNWPLIQPSLPHSQATPLIHKMTEVYWTFCKPYDLDPMEYYDSLLEHNKGQEMLRNT